jgi:xanthine dehydrogenase accessory factor
MRDILEEIAPWYAAGERFALATVSRTWSSSPRPIGASMAVSSSGEVVGSVSGGCVEGALYEACQEVLASGVPQRVTYGVSDDDAFEVGLTCGGIIEIFIQAVDNTSFAEFELVHEAVTNDRPVGIATIITEGEFFGHRIVFNAEDVHGTLGNDGLDESVSADARGLLEQGRTRTLLFGTNGERRMDDLTVFVESYSPAPRMIVFGAIDFAAAVARIGKFLGYYVVVCDARPIFATKKRFPDADEIVVSWPHKYLQTIEVNERTALCVLTHDPKFDVPLLELALRTNAGYIGAMGSRKTHNDRLERLREIGMTESEISRLRSPIGLDLGARTPEETAVSIAAEIIADLWGGTKQSLTAVGERAIHPESLASEKENAPTK